MWNREGLFVLFVYLGDEGLTDAELSFLIQMDDVR